MSSTSEFRRKWSTIGSANTASTSPVAREDSVAAHKHSQRQKSSHDSCSSKSPLQTAGRDRGGGGGGGGKGEGLVGGRGRGRGRGNGGGRGWWGGEGVRPMVVGRGEVKKQMECVGEDITNRRGKGGVVSGQGKGKGESTKRARKHRKGKVNLYSFSGGVVTGSKIEAGLTGQPEREGNRVGLPEWEREGNRSGRPAEREVNVESVDGTSSAESWDSRAERLGRYLSANLNLDSDHDEDDDGFVCGGCETDDLSLLEDDFHPVPYPSATHTSATATLSFNPSATPPSSSAVVGSGGLGVNTDEMRTSEEHCFVVAGGDDFEFTEFEDADEQSRNGADQFDKVNRLSGNAIAWFEDGDVQFEYGTSQFGDKLQVTGDLDGVIPQGDVVGAGRDEESEDDGWHSDSGEFAARFQVSSGTLHVHVYAELEFRMFIMRGIYM